MDNDFCVASIDFCFQICCDSFTLHVASIVFKIKLRHHGRPFFSTTQHVLSLKLQVVYFLPNEAPSAGYTSPTSTHIPLDLIIFQFFSRECCFSGCNPEFTGPKLSPHSRRLHSMGWVVKPQLIPWNLRGNTPASVGRFRDIPFGYCKISTYC